MTLPAVLLSPSASSSSQRLSYSSNTSLSSSRGQNNHHHGWTTTTKSSSSSSSSSSWTIIKAIVASMALAYPTLKLLNQYAPLTTSTSRGLGTVTYLSSNSQGEESIQYEMFTDQTNNQYAMDRFDAAQHSITSNTTYECLDDDCIQAQAKKLARAFPYRTDKSEWCIGGGDNDKEEDSNKNPSSSNKEGLILVKVPKAASSTAAGVALRIAQRNKCQKLQWQHRPGRTYNKRLPAKSFMFTSIRDPSSRVLSYLFFMEISIENKRYTDKWMMNRLQHFSGRYGSIEDGQGGFTMQFAALEKIPEFSAWSPDARTSVQNPIAVQQRVQHMIHHGYDFMLVVDRMDESLVALSLLLGIDVGDVLVTSSKVAGSYFYDPPKRRCVPLTKSFTNPLVQKYLNSNDWKAQNYGDLLLHAAASHSLDLTIEQTIGRQRFDNAMLRYRALKAKEQQICAPNVQFPCSSEGIPQPKKARKHCYQRDFGCGYNCIDEMIDELESNLKNDEDDSFNSTQVAIETMEYSSFA